MKVTLRKKGISKDRQSLYLDYYPQFIHPDTGKLTRWEFLNLHTFNKPKTELERNHNKQTSALAENIRAKRLIEVQNRRFGFISDEKMDSNFVDYFRKAAAKKIGTNADNWSMGLRYFIAYAGEYFRFSDLTVSFCEEYKDYLASGPSIGTRKKRISTNTAVSYYAKLRAVLKPAYKAGLLSVNLYEFTTGIKEEETHRDYLELEEFKKLVAIKVEDQLLRNASICSGLTGLRFSDIHGLIWDEVRGTPGNYYFQFKTVKTTSAETLPISDQVYHLLGERRDKLDKVFDGLTYSAIRTFLTAWTLKSGISKHITFHSFRHTYATLQIAAGTDIFTVQKMLGHKHLKTTQIYTKIIDAKKRETTNKIDIGTDF